MIAVVKADAYGHGAIELSRAFLDGGAHTLAVAFVSEARELREAGIKAPLLVLFDRSEIPAFFDLDLIPVIHDINTAREFSGEAVRRNTTMPVHVKIDTGMGRMGLEGSADISDLIKLPGIECVALMSHLSDADLAEPSCSLRQVERLSKVAKEHFPGGITRHIANSAAVLSCPEAHMDAVRPGIALYGASPFEDQRPCIEALKPVMSVSAKVLTVRRIPKGGTISYGRTFTAQRDTIAAVLAAGYADGYSRALSGQAHVLVRGKRAPVAGRVCMDLTVVDVTDIVGVDGVDQGDEAVLLGSQGEENITSHELAKMAGTIPYEILTSLGAKARRVFH